jgi:hypothetical protein
MKASLRKMKNETKKRAVMLVIGAVLAATVIGTVAGAR